ncbi:nuclease [Rhizobium sp. Root268]|nr:nuclease [Rhizobium sp. Root1212]KRD26030.1 nuclease [Rhizobium sp. Root268]
MSVGADTGHWAEEITGPVNAEVLRVVDGDTLLVAARPWPQQIVEVYVRLRDIDAPEIKSDCSAIHDAGEKAKAALARMVSDRNIRLMRISGDKYFGRVLAEVALEDGRNPARELLSAGYVATYAERRSTSQSCEFWQ